MTRPMPGPPEHRPNAHPHGDDGWCPICHHLTARGPYDPFKRLTDVETAAHRWQTEADAFAEMDERMDADLPVDSDEGHFLDHIADTWHRFATQPHAQEKA